MEIIKYSSAFNDDWDKIVAASKTGNFLHLRSYMEYHKNRFDDQSILVLSKDRMIAAFPCNRVGDSVFSHGGLTYGGLLYGNDVRASDVLQIFSAIGTYFKGAGCEKIIYKAVPHVFHRYPAEEDLYALFRVNANLIRRDISSVIEISKRPKLSDSRKSTARKAEKAGVAVQELADLSEFHGLLSSVLERLGVSPVHSEADLLLLKGRFPEKIRSFGALLNGELLAGALVYDFGHIVHCQYLASSEQGKLLGALDYILIYLIQELFTGKEYFSFGISTEKQGCFLNDGLIWQKESFGGRGIVHDFYEWSL